MRELLDNVDKVHTTELGISRIKRNLNLENEDVVELCKKMVTKNDAVISKKGKNYYIDIDDRIITINSKSFTIITAHKK